MLPISGSAENTLRAATTKAPCRRCAPAAGTFHPAALIEACEMDLPAHRIAKVSGIGCSSSADPALSRSHGFNSVHGRMPSVTTGAAWQSASSIGVSGTVTQPRSNQPVLPRRAADGST
jgi:pyruvate/2-oxoacid:ferredoxin oxidoreductase beta subunit